MLILSYIVTSYCRCHHSSVADPGSQLLSPANLLSFLTLSPPHVSR